MTCSWLHLHAERAAVVQKSPLAMRHLPRHAHTSLVAVVINAAACASADVDNDAVRLRVELLSTGEWAVCGFDAADVWVVESTSQAADVVANLLPFAGKAVAVTLLDFLIAPQLSPPLRHRRIRRRGVDGDAVVVDWIEWDSGCCNSSPHPCSMILRPPL